MRDQVPGAGLNSTCGVRACFIHRLLSAELSSTSIGSISLIYWSCLKIVWLAIVKSDHRKGLEYSLLLTSAVKEPVFELHAASLNCTVQCSVESTEDQTCVSVLCRFCKGNSHGKAHGCYIANLDGFPASHEKWALYSGVDSSQPSAVWRSGSSFRRWLLWSLHSRSRWPSPGMRPACMKIYFLGHLQGHNLWYCARWTPTVTLACWLCIDCLLSTWNLADQLSKLFSNVTWWRFTFESCRNRIPERGSPTCCWARTLNCLGACLLQIAFSSAELNLPLCAQFLRY